MIRCRRRFFSMCLSSMARSLYPIFRRKWDASFHPSPSHSVRTSPASPARSSFAEGGENHIAICLRLEQAPGLRIVKADIMFLPEEDPDGSKSVARKSASLNMRPPLRH